MPSHYSLPLVLLSYAVAAVASRVVLDLERRLRHVDSAESTPQLRWPWIIGGAFAMGTGIWSMHFIGMLAFHLPIPVTYDLSLTAASYLIAAAVSAFALYVLHRSDTTLRGIALPGVCIGIGIAAMHYTGMAAMRMFPGIVYDPLLFATSVLIAIVASIAALWIAFRLPPAERGSRWQTFAAAAVMGAAITGMHYTGMAAASFAPNAICISSGPRLDTTLLAITISAFTFLILGSTLLLSIIDARLQSAIARSAEVLRTANEELERRVAERTLHLTREQARSAAILEDLRQAKDAAETANRAKSKVLAAVSHDIRTPMNAILGQLELLSRSRLEEEQRDRLTVVRDSSRSLLRLIDDILDFSKIEAGKIEIRREPTHLPELVSEVVRLFNGHAAEKGLRLIAEVSPEIPELVSADSLRLRQVLRNFLSNAIKFTERGSISVKVRPVPVASEPHLVRFDITDSGIGMDGETIGRLFQPYVQGGANIERSYGGTGLGLAICSRLAELMSGRLEVMSHPGEGTTVSLILPLGPAPVDAPAVAAEPTDARILPFHRPAPSSVRDVAARCDPLVLIVDDDPANRGLLIEQLAVLGHAAEAAASGAEALALMAERRAAGSPHALVITDCRMPDMDGYELTRRIRQLDPHGGHRPAIIALTADTIPEALNRCYAAGMDDVLTKPLELDALESKLKTWLLARAGAVANT
jgi:signal transduction histidine kinase/ActR/RegA family two-component response regulator